MQTGLILFTLQDPQRPANAEPGNITRDAAQPALAKELGTAVEAVNCASIMSSKVNQQCRDYTGIQHWELCAPT